MLTKSPADSCQQGFFILPDTANMAATRSSTKYASITKKCFINAPVDQLFSSGLLELFLSNNLQPEIGLEGNSLWKTNTSRFAQLAEAFKNQNLQCTLHAPFFDLVPGGFDQRVVAVTREKLTKAFALLQVFKPASIVCHLGFEENKHRGKFNKWLETALETWYPLLDMADQENTLVMFENTYEISPDVHEILFEKLDAPHLGFCMDTGHLTAFAHTSWHPWIETLGTRLGQLHLHDNDGNGDNHIALGKGIFDFSELFSFLRTQPDVPLLTLEPHTEHDLWQSLAYIQKNDLFKLGIVGKS
jgi:sugar phosphate isomerase/epimerase